MSGEENAAEPSEIGGDLKLLALSLGFAWPEDEAGRWRVLKLMAGMASHWRAKYSEVQAVTWRGVERERMYQHMRRRAVSLAAKVNNLRRCLRDYMAGQRVAVAEARAEFMAAKAAHAEIERLRLTDAEREAVEDGIRCVEYVAGHGRPARADLAASAVTLRGLLERLA